MRSLPDLTQKIKRFLSSREEIFTTILQVLLLLGVGGGAYILGATGGLNTEREGLIQVFSPRTEALPESKTSSDASTTPAAFVTHTSGAFVASKKGTKYHRVDCPGAVTIKTENKIYFHSESEARAAGFGPAGNCSGLK